jgi:hypothetical protein
MVNNAETVKTGRLRDMWYVWEKGRKPPGYKTQQEVDEKAVLNIILINRIWGCDCFRKLLGTA